MTSWRKKKRLFPAKRKKDVLLFLPCVLQGDANSGADIWQGMSVTCENTLCDIPVDFYHF